MLFCFIVGSYLAIFRWNYVSPSMPWTVLEAPSGYSHFDVEGWPHHPAPPSSTFRQDRFPWHESHHATDHSSSRHWLQQMAEDGCRSASTSSDHGSHSVSPHPTSHLYSMSHRKHLASPQQRAYHHHRQPFPMDSEAPQHRAVARLWESCALITHNDHMWAMPLDLRWETTFLNESFLLFPNHRMLLHLCYWVVCSPNNMDVHCLLELTISRNMKFIMVTKLGSFAFFRQRQCLSCWSLQSAPMRQGFKRSI